MRRDKETEASIKAEIDLNRHRLEHARKYKRHCSMRYVELYDAYWAAHENHVASFGRVRQLEHDNIKLMRKLHRKLSPPPNLTLKVS